MKRYLKIAFASWRFCLLRGMEFRAEVVTWSINSVLWVLVSLLITNLIFGQVDSIAGWTRSEALVLSVTGSMFNSCLWFFVYPSLIYLNEAIRKGDFDFYLIRPISTQFLISVSRFEFDNYLRVIVAIYLLFLLAPAATVTIGIWQVAGFVLLLILGLVMYYCLFLVITTLGFWLINMEFIEDLFDSMVTMGRYPTNIFGGGLRFFFYFVIPMVFVATFPVSVLLGKSDWRLVGLGAVVAGVFLLSSHLFWNFALKHYSSASS